MPDVSSTTRAAHLAEQGKASEAFDQPFEGAIPDGVVDLPTDPAARKAVQLQRVLLSGVNYPDNYKEQLAIQIVGLLRGPGGGTNTTVFEALRADQLSRKTMSFDSGEPNPTPGGLTAGPFQSPDSNVAGPQTEAERVQAVEGLRQQARSRADMIRQIEQ
jgi:hypothetical protein